MSQTGCQLTCGDLLIERFGKFSGRTDHTARNQIGLTSRRLSEGACTDFDRLHSLQYEHTDFLLLLAPPCIVGFDQRHTDTLT